MIFMTFLWLLVTRSYLTQVQGPSRAKLVEVWLAKVDVYSSHKMDNRLGPKKTYPHEEANIQRLLSTNHMPDFVPNVLNIVGTGKILLSILWSFWLVE